MDDKEDDDDGDKPKTAKAKLLKKLLKKPSASPKTPAKAATPLKAKSPKSAATVSKPYKTLWSNDASRSNVQARAFYEEGVKNKGLKYAHSAELESFKQARGATEKRLASLG